MRVRYIIALTLIGVCLVGALISATLYGYLSSPTWGFSWFGYACILLTALYHSDDMKKQNEEENTQRQIRVRRMEELRAQE